MHPTDGSRKALSNELLQTLRDRAKGQQGYFALLAPYAQGTNGCTQLRACCACCVLAWLIASLCYVQSNKRTTQEVLGAKQL